MRRQHDSISLIVECSYDKLPDEMYVDIFVFSAQHLIDRKLCVSNEMNHPAVLWSVFFNKYYTTNFIFRVHDFTILIVK